jgi:hypothetical protein
MVTGQARVLQERDPRKVRVVYERPRWHEAWDNNPRIAGRDEVGDFQQLRARDGYRRPYIAAKGETQWTWQAWGPPVGELYFSHAETLFGEKHAGRVIVEPTLKMGASPNKQWPWRNWEQLVAWLRKRGIKPAQLGTVNTQRVTGADFIGTASMRQAAAVIARARAVVVPEGGMHHVAAATGTPAVVIYGGYIAPAVTGYASQRNVFINDPAHPLGCGMRVRCPHCVQAMERITPELVTGLLETFLQ